MRSRLLLGLAGCSLVAACAGVSPRPEQLAERTLPDGAVSDAQRQRAAAHAAEARRAIAGQRDDEAEHAASLALALDPRHARARAALGLALVRRSSAVDPPDLFQRHRGEGELRTASRLAPADPVVGLMHANALAAIGHLTAAVSVAEDVLRAGAAAGADDYLELVAAAANWCYELGEERRALPHLQTLAARRSDDARGLYRLAGSLLRIAEEPAQAAEAAAVFERCAALEPDDADVRLAVVAAWVRAAELASAAEQVEAARAHLQRAQAACSLAAERQPEAAEPWFRAGVIAERSGDPAAAIAAYEQALRRDGVHLGSLLNLAALFDAASDARARGLWQRVLSLDAERAVLRTGERQRIEAALAR